MEKFSFVTEIRSTKEAFQSVMERLVIHQIEDKLELNGFVLQNGDGIEILVLGTWLAGVVAHDKRGWYLETTPEIGIRLKTGLAARLGSLAPESVVWQ